MVGALAVVVVGIVQMLGLTVPWFVRWYSRFYLLLKKSDGIVMHIWVCLFFMRGYVCVCGVTASGWGVMY